MKKNVKQNNKVHVKVGDKVKVIAGSDKGKIGLIKLVLRDKSQVIVEDVNIKVKCVASRGAGQTGELKRLEFPIHSSNVSKIN
jgi:large subunit ribosomal protein L24